MKLRTSAAAAGIVAAALLSSIPAHAADKLCKLAIGANDVMQYDKKVLSAAADCTQIELTLTHTGQLPAAAMGHNWVLVKSTDLDAVANAGISAGLASNYLQPGDSRVIAATSIVGGGKSTTVTFPTSRLKAGEKYTFLCTFPGHNALMRGEFHFG
jgi:azurin